MVARLMNTTTLLQAYLHGLIARLSTDGDPELTAEMTPVSTFLSLLNVEMSRANGKAGYTVISSCRPLWLSQTDVSLREEGHQVLLFGLSLVPRAFTKCMDVAIAPITSKGMMVLNDLDQWFPNCL